MRHTNLFWAVPAVFIIAAAPLHAADRIAPGTEARNAKAAFVYLSQATKDAALKPLDAALVEQRKRADQLNAKLTDTRNQLAALRKDASASKSRIAELERLSQQAATEAAEAQEKFTQELAAKDADYARELAILRTAADDILATPEGLKYLEANNAGDLDAADAIEDKLMGARQKMRDLQAAADRRAFAVVALDNANKGLRTIASVVTRYEEVTRLDPGNHKDWITLANLYAQAGNTTASIAAAERAAGAAGGPLQQSEALSVVASSLLNQGQSGPALELAQRARSVLPSADADIDAPEVWSAIGRSQILIGKAFFAQTNLPEAIAAQQSGIEAERKALLLAPQRRDLRDALANRLVDATSALRRLNRPAESAAMLEEARQLMVTLTDEVPDFLPYRRSLIRVHGETAVLLFQTERFDEALVSIDQAIAMVEPLVGADPGNIGMLDFLQIVLARKGRILSRSKREADATPVLERAVKTAKRLNELDPKSERYKVGLRNSLELLGTTYYHRKLFPQALETFLEARRLVPDQADQSYSVSDNFSRGVSFNKVGMTYFGMGDVAAARDQYLQGYKIAKHLIEKFPDVREHKSLMSDLLFNLAQSKTEGFSWKMSADYFDGLIKEGIATPSTVANAKLTREYAKQEKEKASAP